MQSNWVVSTYTKWAEKNAQSLIDYSHQNQNIYGRLNGAYSNAKEQIVTTIEHVAEPVEDLAFVVMNVGGRIINLLGSVVGREICSDYTFSDAYLCLMDCVESLGGTASQLLLVVPNVVMISGFRLFSDPTYSHYPVHGRCSDNAHASPMKNRRTSTASPLPASTPQRL